MEQRIKDLIDKLDITLKYSSELECDGTYLPKINWIIINSSLSESKQFEVLLHELGHAYQHHDCMNLYNATLVAHSKLEFEANKFMIEELVNSYMAVNDLEPKQVNYVNFISENNLNSTYITVLKKILHTKLESGPKS